MPNGERSTLAVVTRDRADILQRCLLPTLAAGVSGGYPVLIVDQSADERTAQLVDGLPGVTYLRSGPGLSVGRNAAVAATTAELIAFTDDDVALPAGWLQRIVELFARHPDAGAVCGRATVASTGQLAPGVDAAVVRWPANPFGLGSGFNMALRRAALVAAGAFDEELGAGALYRSAEDSDMFYRIMRSGWSVVCSDDITVVHDDWRGRREEVALHFGYGLGAGAQTAGHVQAGDRVAGRLALREAGRHLLTVVRAVVTLRFRVVPLQWAFLAGLATGYRRRRRSLRGRHRVIRS
jgi:GT2 family glycosyltransferase